MTNSRQENPLVSVLMTAYNREKYIAEAIESVIASTYQNWELIIVDDCSSDKTVEIARSYEAKDSRIKVYINEENLGDYPNRNRAASYAKGKYLKYVDADDMIYPHGLDVMVRSIEQFPEAGLAISRNASTRYPYPRLLQSIDILKGHFFESKPIINSPLSTIIKREAFFSVGQFSHTRNISDMEMWLKLSMSYPVVEMVQGLFFYRIHDAQENKNRINNIVPLINTYHALFGIINSPENPLPDDLKTKAQRKVKQFYIRKVIRFAGRFKIERAIELYKECKFSLTDFYHAFPKRRY